jgi:hypothetical protein
MTQLFYSLANSAELIPSASQKKTVLPTKEGDSRYFPTNALTISSTLGERQATQPVAPTQDKPASPVDDSKS